MINNAIATLLPTNPPLLPVQQVQKPTAAMSMEERRLMMRHYRNGGNVQVDVSAYKQREQKILKEKIDAFAQELFLDLKQMQLLIDELIAEDEGDSPFTEIIFQNKVVMESFKNTSKSATDLKERVENTGQALVVDRQKIITLTEMVVRYTGLVYEAKMRQSRADVAIENASTVMNMVVVSSSRSSNK